MCQALGPGGDSGATPALQKSPVPGRQAYNPVDRVQGWWGEQGGQDFRGRHMGLATLFWQHLDRGVGRGDPR